MTDFTHLMWHCLETPEGKHFDKADVERWHLQHNGWSRVGYSAIFLLDGTLQILIPFDKDDVIDSWEISNGARGWNGRTRHVGYVGGMDRKGVSKDTRTPEQLASMQTFAAMHTMMWPKVKHIGHNQVNRQKTCPSFDVPSWCEWIGIPKQNIDHKIYY